VKMQGGCPLVTDEGVARDVFLEIPAVGRKGESRCPRASGNSVERAPMRRRLAGGRASSERSAAGYLLWWRATAVPPPGMACFSALYQMPAMTA